MLLRKFLLTVGFLLYSAPTPDSIITFERHHDRFVRDYFGCPPSGEISSITCHSRNARLNYGEFLAAKKAAMKLYEIEECQQTTNSR